MSQTIPLTPADRLRLIIEGMCQTVARRSDWRLGLLCLAGPLLAAICKRLRGVIPRFARAAQYAATPAPTFAAIPSRKRPPRLRQSCPSPLPRGKAWLLRLVPETAGCASQLRHLLADPEVASLLAASPKLQSIFRPLCHALGIRPDYVPALYPPPQPRLTPPLQTQPPDAPPLPFQQRHALPEPSAEQSKVPLSLLNGRIAEVTPPALATHISA